MKISYPKNEKSVPNSVSLHIHNVQTKGIDL